MGHRSEQGRRQPLRAVGLATVASLAVGLGGCGAIPQPGAATAPASTTPIPTPAVSRTAGPAGECPVMPAPGPQGEHAAIDYVDFVRWQGREFTNAGVYAAWGLPTVTATDLGPVAFTVRCAFSTLNELTQRQPTEAPGDRDAAFLAPGTPVYAVRGWPTSCRLAARAALDRPGYTLYVAVTAYPEPLAPMPCERSTTPEATLLTPPPR